MFKLITLTAASIFVAEAMIMLFLESFGEELSFLGRTFLDSTLLLVCVFPSLYFLVFKKMTEQIRLRRQAEETQHSWNQSLELMVEERTVRLQRANEDLLAEVQERAKTAMALSTALHEARAGKNQLQSIINAVSDALVVVDEQWQVQIANLATETMFGVRACDLAGQSLKDFLRPWSESPAGLDGFFEREREDQSTFLTPPGDVAKERPLLQMRFGPELDWNGQPATVLIFSYRDELSAQGPRTASSNG